MPNPDTPTDPRAAIGATESDQMADDPYDKSVLLAHPEKHLFNRRDGECCVTSVEFWGPHTGNKGGMFINWLSKVGWFGQYTLLVDNDGKLVVETECDSKLAMAKAISALVSGAEWRDLSIIAEGQELTGLDPVAVSRSQLDALLAAGDTLDRYLTIAGVASDEVAAWREAARKARGEE